MGGAGSQRKLKMPTLTCRLCGHEKSSSDFYVSKASKSGFRGECKTCSVAKARAWNLENADKCRDRERRRYAADPSKKRTSAKKWNDKNPDRVRENHAKWHAANAGKVRNATKAWALANPERYREICRKAVQKWRASNLDKVREKSKTQYYADRERNIERAKLWNASNPERFRESCRRWANKNPQKLRAYERNRKLAKIERTPPWYGEFDQFVFEEAFSLARQREEMTGIGWHVDHMLPLRGRRVSGLHAGINAQVIPAALNLSKGNKMLYTKPGEWVRAI